VIKIWIKVIKILYICKLLLNPFCFCETVYLFSATERLVHSWAEHGWHTTRHRVLWERLHFSQYLDVTQSCILKFQHNSLAGGCDSVDTGDGGANMQSWALQGGFCQGPHKWWFEIFLCSPTLSQSLDLIHLPPCISTGNAETSRSTVAMVPEYPPIHVRSFGKKGRGEGRYHLACECVFVCMCVCVCVCAW